MFRIFGMASLLSRGPVFSSSAASVVDVRPLGFCFQRLVHFCPPAGKKPRKNSSFRVLRSKIDLGSDSVMPAVYSRSQGFCAERRASASGEIHVIVGPMFAGKTTTLLKRMKAESTNGRTVAIVKSDKDTRYGRDLIVTHDGESLPCLPLPDLLCFREKLGIEAYEKLEVIGIDEAQFFDDLYDFCCKAADFDGKTIIVAGLDGDYRRRFGSVLDIIPIADTVTKLTSRCDVCGDRAFFTLRKTDEMKTELIGGAEVYMPVCRKHYVNGQVVKEAAKAVLEAQSMLPVSASLV